MKKTKAIVITGNGTNCEVEAANACRLGGFDEAAIVHISELLAGDVRLDDYHFLNLTGGFLDGDDLGSAKAQANRFKYARVDELSEHLLDQLLRFIADGKPILGVCNGFQLMVKMGLLPAFDGKHQQVATLTFNDCGRFQDRWVYLKNNPASPSLFTKGIEKGIYLPIRHGEGKFVTASSEVLDRIEARNLAVLKYSDAEYAAPTMEFPHNPNGSMNAIAGVCDETGRLMGLMPHPEAYHHRTNHPRWTREELPEEGDGLILFRNAAVYARRYLL